LFTWPRSAGWLLFSFGAIGVQKFEDLKFPPDPFPGSGDEVFIAVE
jgi:hypothetical protein